MNRRRFILQLTASAALLATPAMALEPGDYLDPFSALAKAIKKLLSATDLLAEGVTQDKFRRLALDVDRTLSEIQELKRRVFEALVHPACSARGDPAALARAGNDAEAIMALLARLASEVRKLGQAVRPSGVAETVIATADEISALRRGKGHWIGPLADYCSMAPKRRTAFRQEVRRSHAIVVSTRRRLAVLIDRLR
jgi:hypothetical protein